MTGPGSGYGAPTPAYSSTGERTRVRIPADVDRPDRILAGLTVRQLAILAVCGVLIYAAYTATRRLLPPAVFVVLAFPVAAAGGGLALASYDRLSMDRLAAAALRFARTPHRQVPADGPVPPGPHWSTWPAPAPPARLRLPGDGMDDDGVLDLGADGAAVVCRCSSLNFALRTPAEQQALIAAFARFLNALPAPAQIVVRIGRIDLRSTITALQDAAGGLPHPGLEAAARSHATFLKDLADRSDLLARELLLVLREPLPVASAGRWMHARARSTRPAANVAALRQRADHARSTLAAAGVSVEVLDLPAATAVLSAAANPGAMPLPAGLAAAGAVITGQARSENQHDRRWERA